MMDQKKPSRKHYTSEFKEQAVNLAAELGNIEAASRQLDIGASVLWTWVSLSRVAQARGMGLADSLDETSRNAALEHENARLRQENEILKKATAYFAADHLSQSTPGSRGTARSTR